MAPRKQGNGAMGREQFIARHKLWNTDQRKSAQDLAEEIKEKNLQFVRAVYCDQHGISRGKVLPVTHFLDSLANGIASTHALFAMDTANNIYLPVFADDGGFGNDEMGGAGDMLMVPDPATFRILPWAPDTGWVLCDLYLKSGKPMPFSPRGLLRRQLKKLDQAGYELTIGLEVEFHLFRIDDANLTMEASTQPAIPPSVVPLTHGYQYQSEQEIDAHSSIMYLMYEHLQVLGLPVRSIEDEWGPGQCEITLDPQSALDAADTMILLRSTLKQVAKRNGCLITFMCKPALPNVYSSGWHLHQSLTAADDGKNAFTTRQRGALLSVAGQHYVGGLINHAAACTAFSNPTINGYKRLNANPLAPNRAVWSIDNKAAYLRLVGGGDDPVTHIENRSGEPAANPYLFIASQVVAGLDGLKMKSDPGPPVSDPYTQIEKPALPRSLMESITALQESKLFLDSFGETFVNYYLGLKQHEIHRFLSSVTNWEHQEYFERY